MTFFKDRINFQLCQMTNDVIDRTKVSCQLMMTKWKVKAIKCPLLHAMLHVVASLQHWLPRKNPTGDD